MRLWRKVWRFLAAIALLLVVLPATKPTTRDAFSCSAIMWTKNYAALVAGAALLASVSADSHLGNTDRTFYWYALQQSLPPCFLARPAPPSRSRRFVRRTQARQRLRCIFCWVLRVCRSARSCGKALRLAFQRPCAVELILTALFLHTPGAGHSANWPSVQLFPFCRIIQKKIIN